MEKVAYDPAGRVHTFCHAVPDKWHVMGVTQGAGLSLQWFRNQLAPGASYDELTAEAATRPRGAQGLFWLPYLMGERTPHLDATARGGWIGLTASHTRADLIRAVIEGVSYSQKDCLDIIEELGVEVNSVRASGGGARSPFWRRLLADIFGKRVVTLETQEGSAYGAALLALAGTGAYASVPKLAAPSSRSANRWSRVRRKRRFTHKPTKPIGRSIPRCVVRSRRRRTVMVLRDAMLMAGGMSSRKSLWAAAGALAFVSILAAQMPWRVYRSLEGYDNVAVPEDYQVPKDWVFARLMYPPHPRARFTPRGFGMIQDWREGGTSWSPGLPSRGPALCRRPPPPHRHGCPLRGATRESGRRRRRLQLAMAGGRRNGRLAAHRAADRQAARLPAARRISVCWTISGAPTNGIASMRPCTRCFPIAPSSKSPMKTPIFHTVYDLDDRYQILGSWAIGLCGSGGFGQSDRWVGTKAQWKGIYDDKSRLMVAISFNSDIGDSWEWADNPCYPEKYSALGIRIGVNYVTYDLTH